MADLQDVLTKQAGVVSRAQLTDAGVPASQVGGPGSGRRYTRLLTGAYTETERLAGADLAQRAALGIAAARLVSDVDFVGVRRSAAAVHGLPLLGGVPDRPQLAERREERPRHHGQSRLVRPDECVTVHGVPVTALARTAVDVARGRDLAGGLVTMDAALARGATREQLEEVLARSLRWPGVDRARRALEHADGRSETALESLGRAQFIAHGLPPCELQVVLGDADGPIGRVDHYWAEHRTVAEGDGALKYTDAAALFEEKRREDRLREAGFEVVRYTWDEVLRHPEIVIARILRAFARHAARSAA